MELNDTTINILKNYATINPNIVINEGNQLKTISNARNVLSTSEVNVEFPQTLGLGLGSGLGLGLARPAALCRCTPSCSSSFPRHADAGPPAPAHGQG